MLLSFVEPGLHILAFYFPVSLLELHPFFVLLRLSSVLLLNLLDSVLQLLIISHSLVLLDLDGTSHLSLQLAWLSGSFSVKHF